MPRPVLWLAAGGLTAAALLTACHRAGPPAGDSGGAQAGPRPAPGKPWFEDVTTRAGIDFVHFDSATPSHYLPEVMGSGVGWIDYDADGWPDLFCVQVGPLVGPPDSTRPLPTHKLYRNNRDGTFTDVTEAAGLAAACYGMGCAVGDYDNDGFDDLLVTRLGGLTLYHNEPDGRGGRHFVDVTAKAGLSDPHWATSCGWGDVDGDGFLDLYVCNYCEVDLKNYHLCTGNDPPRVYVCPPTVFPAAHHRLYRNNRDGTFTDVTRAAGIEAPRPAAGLGVALADLDGDGKIDIYVANDLRPAYVFHNQGGGRFVDRAEVSGAALTGDGRYVSGMGIAIGDIDGSGRPSVVVTNFQDEPTMVYRNSGRMVFREWSHASGLGPATLKTLGFGVELFDADLDGRLDLVIANGHVVRNAPDPVKHPFKQAAQMFVGDGAARFAEVSDTAGGYFRERRVGRGLAVCDFDNDGRPDLVITHNGGPAKVLRNVTETGRHWVRLDLVGDGVKSNRNAVGAKVVVEAEGRKQVRWVVGGGSYLSAPDRRILVGLGAATRVDRVTVAWPSGRTDEFRDLPADAGWRLTEGVGGPERAPGPR